MDCKKLIYHPTRQEAIAPIGNGLIKWDVSTHTPRIVDEFPLPFDLATIPVAVLIKAMDAIAIAPATTSEGQTLELRCWNDGQLIATLALDHQAYDEDMSKDDEFCGHERCCAISALAIDGTGRYLAALEPWGDLHVIDLTSDLQSPRITRWRSRYPDYSDVIVFDPQFQFLIWNWVDQDECFEVFRIDDTNVAQAMDPLVHCGHFDGAARCHRGALIVSPFVDAFVHTDYFSQSRITYRRFNRASLLTRDPSGADRVNPGNTPLTTVDWHRELALIHYPHDASNPWQTSVAFVDDQKLIWAAGEALVLLNSEDGTIAADYHTKTVIRDIAFDCDRHWVIVATTNGIITISLSQFDPQASYVKLVCTR